jgi:NAD+ diphosphatase
VSAPVPPYRPGTSPAATPSPPNLFAQLALDRAGERREDTAWLDAAWPRARVLCVDFEGQALLHGERLLSFEPQRFGHTRPTDASFLGLDGDTPWFALAAQVGREVDLPDGARWMGLREAAAALSAFQSGLFAYAKALLLWQTRARYCGACGSPTALSRAGHSARCSNPDCRLETFPRLDAAIIVLVENAGRALLGRQAGWPPGRYSTLAGFVEPGESLEDALIREVREESGVRVASCRYHSSQPWPFPASLMLGFFAEASDPTIELGDELEDARWFSRAELRAAIAAGEVKLPPRISISRRLVQEWLDAGA